ncbi:hypothetical protein [Rhodanobacter sp. MP7CTX1]|uniref:hypothetical protein n=1 Tax=Rhodanobacter sp. MP7CTX1 TaxID=2723084 RepID=UPI0017C07208|nr:hypothetical protein [Rhodanobacter sp. MP7CTX1]MBB6185878.1 hypothetical protein [Rhodanobacter sp. MP7CTX1]
MEKRVKTEKDRSIPGVGLTVLEAHTGTKQPYAVASIGVGALVALYVATTNPAAEDVGGQAELAAANEVWGEYNLPKGRDSAVTIHVTHSALQSELRGVDAQHTKTQNQCDGNATDSLWPAHLISLRIGFGPVNSLSPSKLRHLKNTSPVVIDIFERSANIRLSLPV